MNNYLTKFAIGEPVWITEGLYKNQTGVVIDYRPMLNNGFVADLELRREKFKGGGMYEVRIGWFKTVCCFESSLERNG